MEQLSKKEKKEALLALKNLYNTLIRKNSFNGLCTVINSLSMDELITNKQINFIKKLLNKYSLTLKTGYNIQNDLVYVNKKLYNTINMLYYWNIEDVMGRNNWINKQLKNI